MTLPHFAQFFAPVLLLRGEELYCNGGAENARNGNARTPHCVLETRGLITKKILRLSYDVIITYDNRKLLSRRKIILRFFCNGI